jgi:hypothetical protein
MFAVRRESSSVAGATGSTILERLSNHESVATNASYHALVGSPDKVGPGFATASKRFADAVHASALSDDAKKRWLDLDAGERGRP